MTRAFVLTLSLPLWLFAAGCNSHLLENDQRSVRASLLRLYEDQFMDNLIRTSLKLPVVQLDYGSLSGTQQNTVSGSFEANRTSSGGVANAVQRALGLTLGDEQVMTLNMTGEPIRDHAVYQEFADFIAKGHLKKSDRKPTRDEAHLWRYFDESYYYIANTPQAQSDFQTSYRRVTFVASQSQGAGFLNNLLLEIRRNRESNERAR